MPARIAIVGGGITGLAAAFHLERLTDAEITLYEASDSLGGKVRTDRVGDLLVEQGPDAFFTRKPGVMELVAELGLESELIEPRQSEFFMLVGGRLHPVPRPLASFNVTAETLATADFLGMGAKERALDEPTQPPGAVDDESIHFFFTRRFGAEFSRLVAEPLLAGTHGGAADRLSMKALYPGYLAMEQKHGSIHAGMPASQENKPAFLSFKGGMETIVQGLAENLKRTRICLGTPFKETDADRTLLAVPAPRAADILGGHVADLLGEIEHRSGAVVTFAYTADQVRHPLNGTGFLVPSGEHETITGMTWSSQKWAGRAPAGIHLMRVFMGAGGDAEQAKAAIMPILDIHGEPEYTAVTRWVEALPQYAIGHTERIATIKSAMKDHPNVYLAGTSYEGVGVPDCLRQAKEAAQQIANSL